MRTMPLIENLHFRELSQWQRRDLPEKATNHSENITCQLHYNRDSRTYRGKELHAQTTDRRLVYGADPVRPGVAADRS
jgi:hypothetical protein